jgi:hypothetical protein
MFLKCHHLAVFIAGPLIILSALAQQTSSAPQPLAGNIKAEASLSISQQETNTVSSPKPIGPTEQLLIQYVSEAKKQLADPSIDNMTRKRLERDFAYYQARLADHQTNLILWSNLEDAQRLKDSTQITKAETELSDYLANKLGKIDGKQYPKGMPLAKVTGLYDARLGHGSHMDRTKWTIRIALIASTALPLILFALYMIRRKNK